MTTSKNNKVATIIVINHTAGNNQKLDILSDNGFASTYKEQNNILHYCAFRRPLHERARFQTTVSNGSTPGCFHVHFQILNSQPGEAERRMAAVGLPLAVLIKQKWRRGLITSELNFNSLSISSTFSAIRYLISVLFKRFDPTSVGMQRRSIVGGLLICGLSCQVRQFPLWSLKPVVHRVTTINGIEQSRQKSNLYRRKPAEAVSRILRKNYSTTYMMGKTAAEKICRGDADQRWCILTVRRN
ncbi:hypothetical protein Tsp_11936 [Trichinella spiralis]|uniref:hypothetical protein n=1 Tax=Trichinella spiralis TaxID=6334 RepID=UPI0001EFD20E|nr:hypothetical protein Tsp_11936 [Trichinella spiralis]